MLRKNITIRKLRFFSLQDQAEEAAKAVAEGLGAYPESILLQHVKSRIECDHYIVHEIDIPDPLYQKAKKLTSESRNYQNQLHVLKLDYYKFLTSLVANKGMNAELDKDLSGMVQRCAQLVIDYPDKAAGWSLKGHLLAFLPRAYVAEINECHEKARELQPHRRESRKEDEVTLAYTKIGNRARGFMSIKAASKHKAEFINYF